MGCAGDSVTVCSGLVGLSGSDKLIRSASLAPDGFSASPWQAHTKAPARVHGYGHTHITGQRHLELSL